MNVTQRRYLTRQMNALQTSLHLHPVIMKYFFSNTAKLFLFWQNFKVEELFAKPLSHQYLALLGKACSADQDEIES